MLVTLKQRPGPCFGPAMPEVGNAMEHTIGKYVHILLETLWELFGNIRIVY